MKIKVAFNENMDELMVSAHGALFNVGCHEKAMEMDRRYAESKNKSALISEYVDVVKELKKEPPPKEEIEVKKIPAGEGTRSVIVKKHKEKFSGRKVTITEKDDHDIA